MFRLLLRVMSGLSLLLVFVAFAIPATVSDAVDWVVETDITGRTVRTRFVDNQWVERIELDEYGRTTRHKAHDWRFRTRVVDFDPGTGDVISDTTF